MLVSDLAHEPLNISHFLEGLPKDREGLMTLIHKAEPHSCKKAFSQKTTDNSQS